jgi:hypothetical protein
MTDAEKIANAIENGRLIVEQAKEALYATPIDEEYDRGYQQGRKDATRVILISLEA